MAEVNIKTRLSLRYDTLANWNSANPVLNKGEVAVVAIPSTATGNDTYGQDTKPSILFKVGDGTSNFKALPYASGRAADVYAWAKAATKPTYTASEVGAAEEGHIHTGDEIYVSGMDGDTLEDWAEAIATNVDSRALSSDVYTKSQVDTKIKEIQGALEADTNTQYNLEWSETEKLLILSSKDIGGNWEVVTKLTPGQFTLSSAAGTELSGKTFDAVISSLKSKVDGLEQDLDTYYYDKDEVDQAFADLESGLADGSVQVYAAGRAAMDGDGKTISTTYATKTELSNHIASVGPQISALQGHFTEGKAKQAIADKNGNDITTTYATQASLGSVRNSLQDLEGITQTLEGYFTSEGVALEADKATKDGAGNVIATTYATKAELAQDLDELDYESVGAAPLSHTHSASEINYLGNKISAASGKTIQVAVDTVYDGLSTHTSSKANPHGVTAAQVGTYTSEKIEELVQNAITDSQDLFRGHTEASNPHNITKSTVGLGNVLNVASYAKTETMSTTEIGTAIADAEGRASEYADDVVGTLRTAVTNGTVVAGKASKDGNGAVIADTYATKTALSTGLSAKADSSALTQQVTRLEGLIEDAVDEVTEIANGKTKTYVTSKSNKDSSHNNSVFNTQDADVTITPSSKILLIDGTNYLVLSELKLGDIILVKETDVPDRWVSAISSTSATLSKMETAKVDLTASNISFDGEAFGISAEYVDEALDQIYTKASNADTTAVKLTGNQEIDGVKTFKKGFYVEETMEETEIVSTQFYKDGLYIDNGEEEIGVSFPTSSGTLALTSDISSAVSTINNKIQRVEPVRCTFALPSLNGTAKLDNEDVQKFSRWIQYKQSGTMSDAIPTPEFYIINNETGHTMIGRVTSSSHNDTFFVEAISTSNDVEEIYNFAVSPNGTVTFINKVLRVKEVAAGTGISTSSVGNKKVISLDTTLVYVLNGGNAAGAYED